MTPIRRLHPRQPCACPVVILSAGGTALGEGRLLDLSLGGAALIAPDKFEKNIAYLLRFEGLELSARLTWQGARDLKAKTRRYGVHFILSVDQEGRLRALLARL